MSTGKDIDEGATREFFEKTELNQIYQYFRTIEQSVEMTEEAVMWNSPEDLREAVGMASIASSRIEKFRMKLEDDHYIRDVVDTDGSVEDDEELVEIDVDPDDLGPGASLETKLAGLPLMYERVEEYEDRMLDLVDQYEGDPDDRELMKALLREGIDEYDVEHSF